MDQIRILLLLPLVILMGSPLYAEKLNEGWASFAELKSFHLKNEDVTIFYNPERSQLLKGPHPQKKEYDEAGVYISRPLKSELLGPGKGYFTIDCDSGGSWDPGCTILREDNGRLKELIHIQGLNFAFPCNGAIYVDGHNDAMFNVRKKYKWHDGVFVEIKQPFNYVGLDTTTREAIRIYSTQDYQQVVANLPKGSAVTVLINDGDHFLIKTPFGLVGWLKIQEGLQDDSPIIGIYWRGD